ncbi:alginate O-acetyltransferase [Pseudomonas laurentiana]|uniref:alginate O-acetyltransferase AlgX-related protein n=1 Tax=Pseudomonas laurentiana TaxID=2364649 RepID=UPI0016761BFE|nr:alginate biosynthesis protein AlgX [Pseudomonas laurentiana]GGU72971.1 alginate O-acetyltransferase [Pseudomonas laurentiana]
MKTLLPLGLVAVLACFSLPATATVPGKRGACESLECMTCPALSDPQKYAEGRMKLMREIVPGKNRWLFRSMVDLTNDFGIPAPMRPEFARLMAAFRQQGIHVAMAIQPTRGLMHRDKLYANQLHGFDFTRASGNLSNYLQQLRNAGAVVPDTMQLVRTPPKGEYFFRRDHHWTPSGAEATARLLAEEVRRQPFYNELSKKQYRTEPGVMVPKDGTLNLAMSYICGNNYGFQYVRGHQTIPMADDANALFDEAPDPEVILVGDSNAAAREDESKQFNFDGYLKQYLEVDILNYALPGVGQEGSLLEYLLSENYKPKAPPKLIIWELPANYQLESELMYRQLIPAIKGGCSTSTAVLGNHVQHPALKVSDRIELLSNAGEARKNLSSGQGFLDIKISDKNVKDFYVIVYYDNGARDKVWFRREAAVTGGQYYLELSKAKEFAGANLLSVFLEPTKPGTAATEVETRLCL